MLLQLTRIPTTSSKWRTIVGRRGNTDLRLSIIPISAVTLFHMNSKLRIIYSKQEPGTSKEQYLNGTHFLATVLTITEAPTAVMNLLIDIKNIGSRKDVRTDDIIGFLTTNGVTIVPLNGDYETIMTTEHDNPIIIEYSVIRHGKENPNLPISWLQFCLFFKKENLLVPFNEICSAIILGKQFNENSWIDFEHCCKHNLNYRIAPVDKVLIRGLEFTKAWSTTMPPAKP